MGVSDMSKNSNNADDIREAMRMSYDKHYKLAESGQIAAPDTSAAHCALYGALATRYQTAGQAPAETLLWAELAPFLGLSDADGREYLAEYIVYRESPGQAKEQDLRAKVNDSLKAADSEVQSMAAIALLQEVAWGQLVDERTRTALLSSMSKEDTES